MLIRVAVAAVLLLCLAVLFYWRPAGQGETVVTEAAVGNDFYLQDFELRSFTADGRVSHVTRGLSLQRAEDSGEYQLMQPRITLTDDAGRQWQLQADTGDMNATMSQGLLSGDVVLQQQGQEQLQMQTPALRVDTAARAAHSEAGVEIVQGPNRVTSQTLFADLANGRLELSRDVKGMYVPQ